MSGTAGPLCIGAVIVDEIMVDELDGGLAPGSLLIDVVDVTATIFCLLFLA